MATTLLVGSNNTIANAANENSVAFNCLGHKVRFLLLTDAEVTVSLLVGEEEANDYVEHPLGYVLDGTDVAPAGGLVVGTSGWADTIDLTGFPYAYLNIANASGGLATVALSYAMWREYR